jgi:hypothetical protein
MAGPDPSELSVVYFDTTLDRIIKEEPADWSPKEFKTRGTVIERATTLP